jgi:glyoxylase I family protein
MAKLKHIAIATQEPEATARFYREVFDLQIVGRADSDDAEGYYLSDGDVSIAVLRFKDDAVPGGSFGTGYTGIHHIGFQVADASDADAKMKKANSHPMKAVSAAAVSNGAGGHGGRNVGLKYSGPDGVIIDVSQRGWVGADSD